MNIPTEYISKTEDVADQVNRKSHLYFVVVVVLLIVCVCACIFFGNIEIT